MEDRAGPVCAGSAPGQVAAVTQVSGGCLADSGLRGRPILRLEADQTLQRRAADDKQMHNRHQNRQMGGLTDIFTGPLHVLFCHSGT